MQIQLETLEEVAAATGAARMRVLAVDGPPRGRLWLLSGILAVACAISGAALAQGPAPSTPPTAIAEQADRLLKEMGAYLGSAQQFTFHADILFDHVLPSGQKLQFSSAEDVALRRPDGLRVEWSGDLGNRRFWYDGKSVTLYDPDTPFYASEAVPRTTDEALETAVRRLNFSSPLADFLYSDPYKAVRQNVQYGFDLGQNDVNGRSCRTLAFVEKTVDWQIWIEDGPQITPCKLVITYKTQASQPQFVAVFSNWNFAPRIAASVFTPELPPGAEKIAFESAGASN